MAAPGAATVEEDELSKYAAKPGAAGGEDELAKYAAKTPTGETAQHIRYYRPGQGTQDFTKGSPEEAAYLKQYPEAKTVQGKTGQYSVQTNTPYQQAEAARIGEGNKKALRAVETGAAVATLATPLAEVGEAAEGGSAAWPLAKTIGGKIIAPLAKSALGSAGGAALGGEAGKFFGMGKLGAEIGGLAGGLYGGWKGLAGEPVEIPSKWSLIKNAAANFAENADERIPNQVAKTLGKKVLQPNLVPDEPFRLTPPPQTTEAPVQANLNFPEQPKPKTIGELVDQNTGGKLNPKLPLREQKDIGNKLGNRVAMDVGEIGGPMNKAEGKAASSLTEEPARQMGAGPLKPDVPLRGQLKPVLNEPPTDSKAEQLEQRYPDKAVRQMVHANGPDMVDAIGDDKETMKAVHDLTNAHVRQAAINSGEDMGQISVGNRKAVGNQSSRQELFKRMLDKGLTPRQIVDLAKKPTE